MKVKILVVDDEASILQSLGGALEDEGYATSRAASAREALEEARKEPPDLVLLDVWLPDRDGLDVLKDLKSLHPQLPVIIISGHGTIETAVKATKMGAFDFVEKPLSLDRILISIENALKLCRLEKDSSIWKQKAARSFRITGQCEVVNALREQIRMAAPSDATVLITGENGTGKELVARSIHQQSRRAQNHMIEVNCAAIPEELIESELFGHEKGSFTGATERRQGKFDQANGGTLFLDEIGDMTLKTQAKVLRIIQEKAFERVGGARTIRVDARIIAATNKDLHDEIDHGRFRQDLYYRLNVIPIRVPPLRERLEDIPLLVEDFLGELSYKSALGRKELAGEVVELMQTYPWYGNVRELKNFIERLVIMTPGRVVRMEHVPRDFLDGVRGRPDNDDPDPYACPTLKEARNCFETQYLLRRLRDNDWNISLTAGRIGLERSHLHRKIKSLGIRENGEGVRGDGKNGP